MSHTQDTMLVILVLLLGGSLASILFWVNATRSADYGDLRTVLTTTTATFGSLLGIITAGLMFTHGKFSELASELSEKSPGYLSGMLSLEKVERIGNSLLTLRRTFSQLGTETAVEKEKDLYGRIMESASLMFVDFAVLMNLKLQQEGLRGTGFMVSEMDQSLHAMYQEARRTIRKEWQVVETLKRIVDTWEGPTSFIAEKPEAKNPLQSDLKNSLTILELKEKMDKSSKNIRNQVAGALEEIEDEVGKIAKVLREDRMPQLLSQMDHASTIRGKYFYLALVFIATPLFVNLMVLPQLSEGTMQFFRPIVSATSSLSVMGVLFLLLYIRKILSG